MPILTINSVGASMTFDSADLKVLNPLLSDHPTGMGVAAEGIARCLPEGAVPQADRVFRWINSRMPLGPLRIVLRQVAVEALAWWYRKNLVLFTTHHGPMLQHGRYVVVVADFICLQRPFQNRMQSLSFLLCLPRILKNSTAVVTISAVVEGQLKRHFPELDQPVGVIPSVSWRIENYQPGVATVAARVAARHFIFVGANYRHKRLDAALDAIRRLRALGEPVRFTAVGVAREVWGISASDEELERDGIRLVKYASTAEIEALYDSATALLFLSEMEGFGLPPLEAMKKGCPAICNDLPELREVSGDAAIYVDVNAPEALAELLLRILRGKCNELLEAKRVVGFERTRLYEVATVTRRWREFLEKLAGKPAEGTPTGSAEVELPSPESTPEKLPPGGSQACSPRRLDPADSGF